MIVKIKDSMGEDGLNELEVCFKDGTKPYYLFGEYDSMDYYDENEDSFLYILTKDSHELILRDELFADTEVSKEEARSFWEQLVEVGFEVL